MPNEQILRLTRDENQQFWRKGKIFSLAKKIQARNFNSFNAKISQGKRFLLKVSLLSTTWPILTN